MTLEFVPAAEQEVAEATALYEETKPGLGVRFRNEVRSTTTAILTHPLLWPLRADGYRRVNMSGFPFYIAYILRGQRVRIIAVSHGARKPGYFRERLRWPPVD